VVDDDFALRKALHTSLTAIGFTVEEALNGEEALAVVRQRTFDLVLLDINMPGIDGIDTCREIRGLAPQTGIVIITVRNTEDDKVNALDAGADDYVTKPFRLRELVARLRAVLRRIYPAEIPEPSILRAGNLEIDLTHHLFRRGGEPIPLSPGEFELLAFMMRNQGLPLMHAKLLRTLWGVAYGNELEFLHSHVKMLRKKIEDDPSKPEYILTEPSVGYRFRNPTDPDAPSVPLADE
jgi:two-component system KDP operon response regulator KdpE